MRRVAASLFDRFVDLLAGDQHGLGEILDSAPDDIGRLLRGIVRQPDGSLKAETNRAAETDSTVSVRSGDEHARAGAKTEGSDTHVIRMDGFSVELLASAEVQ